MISKRRSYWQVLILLSLDSSELFYHFLQKTLLVPLLLLINIAVWDFSTENVYYDKNKKGNRELEQILIRDSYYWENIIVL